MPPMESSHCEISAGELRLDRRGRGLEPKTPGWTKENRER